MTYEQAVEENPWITRAEALREIKAHHASKKEFFEDCGVKQNYRAKTVLYWLGY